MSEVRNIEAGDMAVVERMAQLPNSVFGLDDDGEDAAGAEGIAPEEEGKTGERRELEDSAEVEREGVEGEEEGEAAEAQPATVKFKDEDGSETEYELAELVASHKAYEGLRGDARAVLERVESQGRAEIDKIVTHQREAGQQTITALATFITALNQYAPQPPAIDMLNPQSANYNPDQYHLAKAQYDRAIGVIGQARQQVQAVQAYQKQLEAQQEEQEGAREFEALVSRRPELRDPAKAQAFAADIAQRAHKHYGVTPDLLDAQLKTSLQMDILSDALAYRDLKAKSGTLQERVAEKAKAKAVPQQAQKQPEPQQLRAYREAREQLKKTGKADASTAKAWEQFV